jgi:hypothetical protein
MDQHRQHIDVSALRFNQFSIAAFVMAGFILHEPILPALVAVVLMLGSFAPAFAVFKLVYAHVVRPLGLMAPKPVEGNPAPHLFAQFLGGSVLAVGTILMSAGFPLLGWILAWCVVGLAVLNLLTGFCAGCFIYYQLGKLGVKGFRPQDSGGGRHA